MTDQKLKALIVDDEVDVCFLLSNILKNRNFLPDCVYSIDEARRTLGKGVPSVVFLDNHLPDGFGVNFIDEIRMLAPGAKIIMITAHDTKTDEERAYLHGVDYFIGKPFTRDTILSAIETVRLKNVEM